MMLIAHRGAWTATLADLASVPVPDPTESYVPVPHPRFVEEVKLHVSRFGLRVVREDYALARGGAQLFGVVTCTTPRVPPDQEAPTYPGWSLAIGLRNSYDRSLAAELVAGARVFVCDNLAFSGEAQVSRKHTVNVFRDLPDLIYRMLSQVSVMKEAIALEIEFMKGRELDEPAAHHLMVMAVRRNALPASRLPQVIDEWDSPRHDEFTPRTAWSLFNAFTQVEKSRSPHDQMDGTLRLSRVFRESLALS